MDGQLVQAGKVWVSFLLAPEEMGSYKKIMKTLNEGNVSLLCPKYLFNS